MVSGAMNISTELGFSKAMDPETILSCSPNLDFIMDINTAPGHCRAMDPDIALGSISGLDVTVSPSNSTVHLDQHRPWTEKWSQVAARMLNILTAFGGNMGHECQHRHGCSGTTDLDMVLGSSLNPGFTLVLGGEQAAHINLFPTTFFLQFCLFLQHVNSSASLSLPFPPYILSS